MLLDFLIQLTIRMSFPGYKQPPLITLENIPSMGIIQSPTRVRIVQAV